jgi:hypothetical protein
MTEPTHSRSLLFIYRLKEVDEHVAGSATFTRYSTTTTFVGIPTKVATFVGIPTNVVVVKILLNGCSTCDLLIVERPKFPGPRDRLPNGLLESFASSSIFHVCNFYISDFSDSLLITDANEPSNSL